MSYNPGEPEEQHDSPDIEQAPHVNPVEPAELDGGVGGLLLTVHPQLGQVSQVSATWGGGDRLGDLALQELLHGGAGRQLAAWETKRKKITQIIR